MNLLTKKKKIFFFSSIEVTIYVNSDYLNKTQWKHVFPIMTTRLGHNFKTDFYWKSCQNWRRCVIVKKKNLRTNEENTSESGVCECDKIMEFDRKTCTTQLRCRAAGIANEREKDSKKLAFFFFFFWRPLCIPLGCSTMCRRPSPLNEHNSSLARFQQSYLRDTSSPHFSCSTERHDASAQPQRPRELRRRGYQWCWPLAARHEEGIREVTKDK